MRRANHIEDDQQEKGKAKTLFQPSLEEILASNCYMTVEDQVEIDILMRYITYRVEWDLYELCKEDGQNNDLIWDDLVLFMQQYRPIRDAAVAVVRMTLNDFHLHGHFDFDVDEIKLVYSEEAKGERDDILHCAGLFSTDEGHGVIECVLLWAEIAQYRFLIDQGKTISWQQYLDSLRQDRSQWNKVVMAYHDALARLDFKPAWNSCEIQSAMKQMEVFGDGG